MCTCFNHTLYAFNNNIRRRTKQLNGVRFSDIKSNKRTIFGDLNYEWIKWLATNKHMEFRWQIIEKFKSFNSIIGKINKLKKHTQRTKTFSVLETTRERNKNRTAAKTHSHTHTYTHREKFETNTTIENFTHNRQPIGIAPAHSTTQHKSKILMLLLLFVNTVSLCACLYVFFPLPHKNV